MSSAVLQSSTRGRATTESVAVLVCLLALWWLASHLQWVSKVFLPTPEATLESLVQGLSTGELAGFTWDTVVRMLLGWLLASAIGTALGRRP